MKTLSLLAALVALSALAPSVALADHSSSEEEAQHEESSSAHEEIHSHEAVVTTEDVSGVCAFSVDLGIGTKGEAVSCLQGLLIESGFLTEIALPTGYFGELTSAALAKWQNVQDVPSTGYFGALSRAQIAMLASHAESSPSTHAHEPLDVHDWDEIPEVSIELHKDAMAGVNLEVMTKHFAFAPEHVNGAVEENEGHAHVYVNGKKYARLYGSWMHLPGELFVRGNNEVRVTLNANDHHDLAHDGDIIEAKEHIHVD